ncbi:hypothetical protein ACLOJK_025632 [Asimina triloba]
MGGANSQERRTSQLPRTEGNAPSSLLCLSYAAIARSSRRQMTHSTGNLSPAVVDSINRSLSSILPPSGDDYPWDPPRRFASYAKRLHLILNQCVRSSSPETATPSLHTAFKGIDGELKQATNALSAYKSRSRIFVLMHCQTLCASLQERSAAIAAWLALLESALLSNPDLHKKTADLARDMQHAQFKVTENEERLFCTFRMEEQIRGTSKAVESAIIMDIARALGLDSDKHAELAEQIRLLKDDLNRFGSVSDRRILNFLERIFESWAVEPHMASLALDLDFDDEAVAPPYKYFLCPLTKEVMKDPVVLESSQTYERTAIQYWFDRCIEDARDPTCPVTGLVLKSLELKPNINLAGAIEEWLDRNIDIQIKSALQFLGSKDPSSSVESIEQVLDRLYKISEEHPSSRYKIRNAGIVHLVIQLLKNCSKSIGSHVRSKALMVLQSMAKDDESKCEACFIKPTKTLISASSDGCKHKSTECRGKGQYQGKDGTSTLKSNGSSSRPNLNVFEAQYLFLTTPFSELVKFDTRKQLFITSFRKLDWLKKYVICVSLSNFTKLIVPMITLNEQMMLESGVTRLAIHSLTASSEKEREYSVKLLLEFSSDESYCTTIVSQKGALVLLSSMAGNLEHPNLSKLAEEILRKVEMVEENIQHLAAAGRFEPLLTRLCEGSEDVKIEMASLIGTMTLTNHGKELIAQHCTKVLVGMLSNMLDGRTASLRALYNLSNLDDNASILVDSGLFIELGKILFKETQGDTLEQKELAASTMANLVSKAGNWELAHVDKKEHSMQSELIIHRLLGLLSNASPKSEVSILQILYGVLSSPQASESAAAHLKSGNGIQIIASFLDHPDLDHRIYGFRLISVLSERLASDVADELRASNKLLLLKEKLLDTQCKSIERSEAACILANLPMSDDEVKTVLGTSLVHFMVTSLNEQPGSSAARYTRASPSMAEGLLGLLLKFARNPDPLILETIKEQPFMDVFLDQLRLSSKPRVKQRAALGLKHLSESARALVSTRYSEPQRPRGFCASLMFICIRAPMVPETCPIHAISCDEGSPFCLLKGNAIKPLAELLNDESEDVQIAAVEALSTLVADTHDLKRAVDELDRHGVVGSVTTLFTKARPGLLQERAIWMVEKFLRVENHSQLYSAEQGLVRALVEAFRHGNSNTRRHAQNSLTNLKQLSVVSGKNSSQTQGLRLIGDDQ